MKNAAATRAWLGATMGVVVKSALLTTKGTVEEETKATAKNTTMKVGSASAETSLERLAPRPP